MAKITKTIWHMEEHYWDITVEVDEKTYEIRCVKDDEDEKMLKCNFKQKGKSLYEVGCCIDVILNDYMIISGFSSIKSQFNEKTFVIRVSQFPYRTLEQIAKQVIE